MLHFADEPNGRVNGTKPGPAMKQPEALSPATSLEKKQQLLAHLVRLVALGLTNGLFVAGAGGLGKSKTIVETLNVRACARVRRRAKRRASDCGSKNWSA
jgi:hypothetical protein